MNGFEKLFRRGDGTMIVPWNRVFDEIFDSGTSVHFPAEGAGWMPAVDVEESQQEYRIRAEIPGLGKEDVKISLAENVLTIAGEKKSEEKSGNKRYHRLERTYGSFERHFSLCEPIQTDKIEAHFKDGILDVKIPKSEKIKPQSIEIKVG